MCHNNVLEIMNKQNKQQPAMKSFPHFLFTL